MKFSHEKLEVNLKNIIAIYFYDLLHTMLDELLH